MSKYSVTTDQYNKLLKLIIVGDTNVGKSNILTRYIQDNFTSESKSTVGIEYNVKDITVNNKNIRVQIWDTAGQERFRTITSSYYRGAHGIILVYDITSELSFNNLDSWIKEFELLDAQTILIGNKIDLEEKRKIPFESGEDYAKHKNFLFLETSAKENLNVNDTFHLLIEQIMENLKSNEHKVKLPSDDNDLININGHREKKKNCCK